MGHLNFKTLLNSKEKYKGFVFNSSKIINTKNESQIEIEILARKGSKGKCSCCGTVGSTYDHLPQRKFIHVPLWGILVNYLYCMRRIDCKICESIKVEMVPWSNGKSPLTTSMMWHLSEWAKTLSWKVTAEKMKTSWHHIQTSVAFAVNWGRERIVLNDITAIGIDEIFWGKGKCATVVYQINNHRKRLLWVSEKRTKESINNFFDWFGKERSDLIEFICTDMWKNFLTVVKDRAPKALNILDRFHIVKKINEAINKVRNDEAKVLKKNGQEEILKNSRWPLLKREKNLTEKQSMKISELLSYNLKTIKAYLLKEEFDYFWKYNSATWAKKFLRAWTTKVMRSRIEPMKAVAKTIRNHEDLILNWFEAKGQLHLGAVEGLNNKLKSSIRNSYGIKTFNVLETMLYHRLGDLPVPEEAHRFS